VCRTRGSPYAYGPFSFSATFGHGLEADRTLACSERRKFKPCTAPSVVGAGQSRPKPYLRSGSRDSVWYVLAGS
jgi:hypothetical protein